MQRVTVRDSEQTISFLTDVDTTDRLIAGCSSNPDTIGELLLATEVLQQGLATAVMGSLIAFDKALQQSNPAQALEMAITATDQDRLVWGTFQVVDDQTEARALDDGDEPLLLLDLTQRTISASSSIQIRTSGEVLAHSGKELTTHAITYVLPQTWTVRYR